MFDYRAERIGRNQRMIGKVNNHRIRVLVDRSRQSNLSDESWPSTKFRFSTTTTLGCGAIAGRTRLA